MWDWGFHLMMILLIAIVFLGMHIAFSEWDPDDDGF